MPLSFPPQPTHPIAPPSSSRVTGLSPAVVNAANLEMEERGGGIPEGARRLRSRRRLPVVAVERGEKDVRRER